MNIAVCAGWTPFSATDLDDLVAMVATSLGSAGHQAEEIRIPSGATDEARLGASLAWRMAPIGGEIAIAVGDPACHLRHARKVVWLVDGDEPAASTLADARRVLATSEALAGETTRRTGVAVDVLLPTDAYVVERLLGAAR